MNRTARKIGSSPQVDLTRLSRGSRAPGPIVRDLSKRRDDGDSGVPLWRAFGTGPTWLIATLVKIVAVFAVALAIVLGPPVLECRQRAATGFFTGDTFLGCVGTATHQRLTRLEDQINRLVRGSGV